MLGPLMKMMGPMMLGVTAGSLVGHLAQRCFGQYDLPIPRPASDDLLVIPATIDQFGEEWSLPRDDLRLWVLVHEIAHHRVLAVDHIRRHLDELLRAHAAGFRSDPSRLEQRLGSIEFDPEDPSGMSGLQDVLGDPEVILGVVTSPQQEALRPQITAITAVIDGYVDHVIDQISGRLIASGSMITEALRRHRVEAGANDRFVERLLGLELTQQQYERGIRFVKGVVERAGPNGLDPLWQREDAIPTPAEVDAPGLWLARIEF